MAFSMDITNPEEVKKEIEIEVQPTVVETDSLKLQAEKNAQALIDFDLDSLSDRQNFLQSIETFGIDTMQKSSKKNQMLKVRVGDLSKSGSEGGTVSKSLQDLQREIKGLDPSGLDFTKKGLLGKLTSPVRGYFEKFEKSENVIADIITSLDKGKTTLKNDNTTLMLEEQNLRELTKKIYKEIEMGSAMDAAIVAKLDEVRATADPVKVRFVEEEILFPLRQRVMDMQQMVVVNQQGIIAMELIQRNNKELMRGVDRAKNVTVSALRTAVMVASALYNQKIVLQKIDALNQTTSTLIASTSKMLKEQGAEIQKQAMESTVSPEVLQQSFSDLMEALNSVSDFKQQALPVMRDTIEQFRIMAQKGEEQVLQLEKGSVLSLENE